MKGVDIFLSFIGIMLWFVMFPDVVGGTIAKVVHHYEVTRAALAEENRE